MTPDTIKNSDVVYFLDGDIVLLSLPKDNVVTAFKVDRVFLLRSSPVFEGMFSLPPSRDVESYDNVPLVELQDESDHLTMFLKALYDSSCIPSKKYDRNLISTVEGILLLATKYQVDHLRRRIVSLLERDWPSKLTDWDVNTVEINARINELLLEYDERYPEDPLPEPCEAICLARKCDVPSLLPAAFYQLSRIRGLTDRRFSDSNLNKFDSEESIFNPVVDFSLLTAEDLRCLIIGRDVMFNTFQGYLITLIRNGHAQNHPTVKDDKCRENLSDLKAKLEVRMLYYQDDPLSMMRNAESHFVGDICEGCREDFFSSLDIKRETFWEQLPRFFLLDPTEKQ